MMLTFWRRHDDLSHRCSASRWVIIGGMHSANHVLNYVFFHNLMSFIDVRLCASHYLHSNHHPLSRVVVARWRGIAFLVSRFCVILPSWFILIFSTLTFMWFFCRGITYYPPKSWAVLIPSSLVFAFVAAPMIYAACNILATPKVDSIHTIWDEHAREPCANLESENNGYVTTDERRVMCLLFGIVPKT